MRSAEFLLFSVSVLRWWRWIKSLMAWEPQLSSTSLSWTTTTTPHSSQLSRTPCRSLRTTTQRRVQEKFSPSCPQTPTSAPTERSPSPSPPLTHSSDSQRWGQVRGLCEQFSARAVSVLSLWDHVLCCRMGHCWLLVLWIGRAGKLMTWSSRPQTKAAHRERWEASELTQT